MEERKRASLKELFGWCMFDFANSSYTTVIVTVIFGDIFSKLIVPEGNDPENPNRYGNILWAVALGISYVFVSITGPLFGAIMDFSARKKQFLFMSYILCIVSTASFYFASNPGEIWLPFCMIIISNFAFASGENFTSSFLPYLGPEKDLGKISAYAWGIGYFGGLASVILVSTLGDITKENFQNLRLVGPYTAAFFLVAGIPTFLFLKEYTTESQLPPGKSYLTISLERVSQTLKDVTKFKDLMVYLIALFFAMASIAVIIGFAFIYGSQEIKIENVHRQAMFVILQFTAAIGAVLFGFIQDRWGALKTFNLTLVIWIISILAIFGVKSITSVMNGLGLSISVQWVFVIITSIAGMGLGATQSSSRAIVAVFAPESKISEFFGLWGISGKVAAATGLFSIGILQSFLSFRDSFLVLALFFVVALVINMRVNEARGIETAKNYKE
ncbi:MAG: MFS transporter [Leptospiraceae bacterium]|nr:MFS transporter [Leptospiraceae bacterium]